MVRCTRIRFRSGDLGQQLRVAGHQVGLGGDAEVEPALAGENFQHPARDPEAALGRLVRIGGGADPDGVARLQPPQLRPETPAA